jgi:hypothetical protein
VKRLTRRGLTRRMLGFGRGVYVVGMHRSGTSAVTRTVNLMGVPLGDPRDLVGAAASSNPTGHWESGALLEINDRLLAALGGSWSAPPIMSLGWERGPAVARLRREARRLFGDIYRTRRWVWKDPRICLTLPFWRSCVPAKAVAILVARHPLEIASSLQARNGFSVQYSLALWERYLRAGLEGVVGLPVMMTSYDDLVRDPGGWCKQVSTFLSRHGFRVAQPEYGELAKFIDAGLRHSELGVGTVTRLEGATPSQQELFDVLRTLAGTHEPMLRPPLPPEEPSTEALLASHRAVARSAGDKRPDPI